MKTLQFSTDLVIGPVTYEKHWRLLPILEIRESIYGQKQFERLGNIFMEREKGVIGGYEIKGKFPKITHEDYLDRINWVSKRTQVALD